MFATTQRDPMLDLMHHLEHRIGRTFNEPLRGSEWPVPEAVTTAWLPLVDIFEEPDAIRLVAELPGVRPSEVQISVVADLLTNRGTKKQLDDAAQGLATRRSGGDPAAGRHPGDERWSVHPGHGQREADPG